jgi:hypothetical protein
MAALWVRVFTILAARMKGGGGREFAVMEALSDSDDDSDDDAAPLKRHAL